MKLAGLQVVIVDAFTRTPGHGNRAGVVTRAAGLDDSAMLAVARAVAASETAFVLAGTDGADLRLRYFTPATEIAFCGHATVAVFHRLAESHELAAPGSYLMDCPAGRLAVELERAADGTRVWIETPRHPWKPSPIPESEVMTLLGGELGMRERALPLQRAGPKLFVPVLRRADLWALTPRWDELAAAGLAHDLHGFFAFTRDALESDAVAHGRFFAPAVGIREDPVTGSANGPLAEYLALHGVLDLGGAGDARTVRARAEQGDAMGKPGRVAIEVTGAPGRIERARVGGVAVSVMEGALCGRS